MPRQRRDAVRTEWKAEKSFVIRLASGVIWQIDGLFETSNPSIDGELQTKKRMPTNRCIGSRMHPDLVMTGHLSLATLHLPNDVRYFIRFQ